MFLKLVEELTAANNAPTAATDGVALAKGANPGRASEGGFASDLAECVLLLRSTAGSGVVSVTGKLWGYSPVTGVWHPLGTHATAASKGIINDGNAIGETGTDKIAHAEVILGLQAFSRVYLELSSFSGTGTAISAWLVTGSGIK